MSKRRWITLSVVSSAALLLALPLVPRAAAQDEGTQPSDETARLAQLAELRMPTAPPKDKDPKRFADADDVTKDMGEMEGLFSVLRYDPSDKKRNPEKLLAKIPAKLLGEDVLFATSISRGSMAGYMWGDALIRFEVSGDQLKLVTPDLRYVRKSGQPVTEAVERTYNDSFMAAVPIVAMSPQGDVIIDLERLLKSNLAGVGSGRVNPGLSTWSKVKVFPDNVLIEADLAFGGGEGGQTVGVAYAFRRLPKLGSYSPRDADPRIGYFLTAQLDWSKKANERDTFNRLIHRWKLEKLDPSLELSPPKEPIVFIIEKTVPIQWRRWVREGIEDWNKAFEKVGYTGAVVVQQQTDDNEFADHDPEDARYNYLRWGVSGRAFAMGPSRVDPRTGQILDADILFDDAFVRAWMYQFDLYGPGASTAIRGPAFEEWVAENSDYVPEFLRKQLTEAAQSTEPDIWAEMETQLAEQGRDMCSYATGMQQQLAFAHYALIATGSGNKKLPERVIGEAIREIVTHEVGHTLGLRHNFKGSAWLTLDEIKQRRDETDEPTTASVMDYTPLLFFAGDNIDEVRHFVTPTIGPYDEWAIQYGYADAKGKPEADMLKEICSHCTEPALQFATDQDTLWVISPDPYVNRYDLSNNPMEYSRARIELADQLLSNITDWAIQDGEPRDYLTRAFNVVWSARMSNLEYVSRVIGGQEFNRDFQGDPNARPAFELLSPETQREALEFLGRTVFSEEFFRVSPELLNMLAPTRWSHWGSSAPIRLDYPIHDHIRAMQADILMNLTAAPVLQRVYDAELKTAADDKFTAAELITTLNKQIWHQLEERQGGSWSNSNPFLGSVERNLQRTHLDMLISAAQSTPGGSMSADLQAMVRLSLRQLSDQIGDTLKNKLDFASEAHLRECKSRIDRVLDATFLAR